MTRICFSIVTFLNKNNEGYFIYKSARPMCTVLEANQILLGPVKRPGYCNSVACRIHYKYGRKGSNTFVHNVSGEYLGFKNIVPFTLLSYEYFFLGHLILLFLFFLLIFLLLLLITLIKGFQKYLNFIE